MKSTQTRSGHCLCGTCGFVLTGPALWTGHCHCESCRRATGSPFTTWIGQGDGTWRMTGDSITTFASSLGVLRGFCGQCGSPLFYQSVRYPGERHFYAALLDDPASVAPTEEYHADERLPWIHLGGPALPAG